jgi:uncharacterized protein with ParB-like and HNH nuclease domain
MKANETILSTFFENKSFKIPDYQRGYDWKNSNFDMLWDDILYYLEDESRLFLGSIILQSMDKDTSNDKRYYVVDGQQRITTITILFIAMRSALYNRRDETEEKLKGTKESKIEEKYLYNHDYKDDPTSPKFLASNSIRNSLEYMCREDWKAAQDFPIQIEENKNTIHLSEQFKKIKPVYDDFIMKIQEKDEVSGAYIHSLESLYKIIDLLNGAQLIEMIVDNEKEAFYLFEVVNARGADLQVGDLLKNHIFSQIPRNYANKKWDEISENTKKSGPMLTRALRYFYFTQGGYISAKELYTKLKGLVNKPNNIDDVEELLDNIHDYSKFYSVITEGTKEAFVSYFEFNNQSRGKLADINNQQEMYESISALNLFGFTQTQPLIYGFFKNFNSLTIGKKDNYKAISKLPKAFLEGLENFHFINYCVGIHRANEVEKKYAEFSYRFNYASSVDEFKSILMELLAFFRQEKDKKDIFYEYFSENIRYDMSKKAVIHYIYHKMNRGHNLNNLQIWKPNNRSNFNIEHWASVNKVGNKEYEKIREKLESRTLNKIGNLLSIDGDQNSSLQDGDGNFSPIQKADWFNKSRGENFHFQNVFLDNYKDKFDTWGKDDIEHRTQKMAEYAYTNIWTIPTI